MKGIASVVKEKMKGGGERALIPSLCRLRLQEEKWMRRSGMSEYHTTNRIWATSIYSEHTREMEKQTHYFDNGEGITVSRNKESMNGEIEQRESTDNESLQNGRILMHRSSFLENPCNNLFSSTQASILSYSLTDESTMLLHAPVLRIIIVVDFL